MKKFIAIIALFVCVSASAGNKVTVDLTCWKGQRIINFTVDWSVLTIKGMSIDQWATVRQAEDPEEDAMVELEEECKPQVEKLTEEVNDKLRKQGIALMSRDDCMYTFCVRPIDIDQKGNCSLQCLVINNETEATIADFVVKADGGHWGSMGNLWGDGFEHAGETLGGILAKAIKKPTTVSWK